MAKLQFISIMLAYLAVFANTAVESSTCPGPVSCKQIYEQYGHQSCNGNRAYILHMDTGAIPVYCHMINDDQLGECGGGGWTLVMKIDGDKRTFHYDSSYWTDKNAYRTLHGIAGLDKEETKLPTYWNTPFTRICLGMESHGDPGVKRFIIVHMNSQVSSLHALIADNNYRPLSVGRNTWKFLIGSRASLQNNCNLEGFNVMSGQSDYSKVRIGFMANQENDCRSGDSRIGFGAGGYQDDSNTCGNEASHSPDNGDRHIRANGYIFVK